MKEELKKVCGLLLRIGSMPLDIIDLFQGDPGLQGAAAE